MKDGGIDNEEVSRFLAAWFAVRQLIQAANFNHFQKAGLSATQFMTLNLLPENGDSVTIGELAKRMNLKPATVAKTVDSLEARDMLARKKSDRDGRLVLVAITKQGSHFQNAAVGHFREHIGDIFRAIPTNDRQALIRGLESLVKAGIKENDESQGGVPILTRGEGAAPPAKHGSRRSSPR